jgi:hypothetical protein
MEWHRELENPKSIVLDCRYVRYTLLYTPLYCTLHSTIHYTLLYATLCTQPFVHKSVTSDIMITDEIRVWISVKRAEL